jgi:PilZ domain
LIELRKNPRAQLRLPVRIRWQGSLGMRLEITETIDVSREGLLLHRVDLRAMPSRVWVAFPFDPAAAGAVQPETPARIVRSEPDPAGGSWVALHMELPQREARPIETERRRTPRIPFALPIFVRANGTPWPEESMTRDISQGGAQFETSHVYALQSIVLAKIPWGEWDKAGEISGRVVRIEAVAGGTETSDENGENASRVLSSVGVEWVRIAKP